MLCKQNTGKYLDNEWCKARSEAMVNRDSTNQEWLELTDDQIGGVYSEDTYLINNSPVDAETSSHMIDIRKRPQNG